MKVSLKTIESSENQRTINTQINTGETKQQNIKSGAGSRTENCVENYSSIHFLCMIVITGALGGPVPFFGGHKGRRVHITMPHTGLTTIHADIKTEGKFIYEPNSHDFLVYGKKR